MKDKLKEICCYLFFFMSLACSFLYIQDGLLSENTRWFFGIFGVISLIVSYILFNSK
jgi:hypothetical protein